MIREAILKGDLLTAKEQVSKIDFSAFSDLLHELAYDTSDLVCYTFVNFLMYSQGERSDLHHLASSLLSHPLCHIEGAYKSALLHSRRASELSPEDVALKEYLLFFHIIPEKLVSKEEAIEIASVVLQVEPNSQVAKDIFSRYGN
ncbi:hypothetical protein NDK47_21225 [Brevibacillus ruminantium]|uniref:Immunity protein 30 domain-containing protein n=1 Tax=Brevibacillus ruminantium TaxID=2950604 RepID=A0ABY4WBS5_9BACL|nr:hypothetical protein [Brevibacillus ruminantium]USG64640.1 hypothetical protein NDK47_21225 [Brevibacillus ruminantium]